jgi:hypothetical protein
MAELMKQQEASPLDAIEKAIQRGDVAAAMKSLDQLSSQLDQLAAGLENTAAEPDARQRALMQEMLAFKDQLDRVERKQQETAAQTERVKNEVRQRLAPKLEEARKGAAALEQLAREARESLDQAIEKVRVGNRLSDISAAVQNWAERKNGYSVVRDLCGHGIGTHIHEEPNVLNYGEPGRGPRLQEGMVFAIEPMVNIGGPEVKVLDDDWTAVTTDGTKSAHFEHTVAVTENGADVLTDGR